LARESPRHRERLPNKRLKLPGAHK